MVDDWSSLAFLDRLINTAPWCGSCKVPGVFVESSHPKMEEGSEVFIVGFECPSCGNPRTGKVMVGKESTNVTWNK